MDEMTEPTPFPKPELPPMEQLLRVSIDAIKQEDPSDWRMAISCLMASVDGAQQEARLFGMLQAVYLTLKHPQWWAFMAQRMAPFTKLQDERSDVIDVIVEHFAADSMTIIICADCNTERIDPNVRCPCEGREE